MSNDLFKHFAENTYTLAGKISDSLEIIIPIVVIVEIDEQENHFVSDRVFCVYGYGETLNLALDDYLISLIEYHGIISARGHVKQIQHLSSYIRTLKQKDLTNPTE